MTLDPDAKAFVERASSRPGPRPSEISIDDFRAGARALVAFGLDPVEVAAIRDVTVEVPDGHDVRIRTYQPSAELGLPVAIWVHGGTWVRGDLEAHDALLRYMAKNSGCVIAAVDQRLAPEAPHPVPLNDVYNASRWVQANAHDLGIDPHRIAIVGDSSGGSLAAAAALRARDEGDVRFALQVLIVPALDLTLESSSWEAFDGKFLITRGDTMWAIEQYAAGADLTEPLLSPLHAVDHSGLPPALIFTAEYDPLRDDGERYAAKLTAAGVKTQLVRFDGLIHHAILVAKVIPAAQAALDQIAAGIGRGLGASTEILAGI
jgi:acetyl esterase